MSRLLRSFHSAVRPAPGKATQNNSASITVGWYGQHPELNLTGVVECSARQGFGIFGVAGGNGRQTFDLYRALVQQLNRASDSPGDARNPEPASATATAAPGSVPVPGWVVLSSGRLVSPLMRAAAGAPPLLP